MSGTVIHWVHNQSKVLGLFEHVRVKQIRDVFQEDFFFVPGSLNPSDHGTRLHALAEQVGPDAVFFKGAPWMKKGIVNAQAEGLIQSMSTFVQQKSSKVALEAVDTGYVKHDLPLTDKDPVDDKNCLFSDAVRASPKPENNDDFLNEVKSNYTQSNLFVDPLRFPLLKSIRIGAIAFLFIFLIFEIQKNSC